MPGAMSITAKTRTLSRIGAALAVATLVVGATACSDDDNDDGVDTPLDSVDDQLQDVEDSVQDVEQSIEDSVQDVVDSLDGDG